MAISSQAWFLGHFAQSLVIFCGRLFTLTVRKPHFSKNAGIRVSTNTRSPCAWCSIFARCLLASNQRWRCALVSPESAAFIATGSNARQLPGAEFDESLILSNDGALRIPAVPKKLGVIGSGVIGLEMGSVWRRLGAEVTILEAAPAFLAAADESVAKEAAKVFKKQGLDIQLSVKIASVTKGADNVTVAYADAKGVEQTLVVDKLIVSIGRVANTIGLNPEAVGLKLDERGAIVVDDECKTNLPNVWAIGDVVRGPMLAHKAEEEGVAVAERIAGQHGHVNFNTIPWVIYTSPEIAWVGRTEQQLKADGVAYKAGQFPFLANGRARALGDTTGFVKFLADATTDEILGVHIIGPFASELISEAVVAMAGPHALIGEQCLDPHGVRNASATAVEPSRLVRWERRELRAAMTEVAGFAESGRGTV